MKENKIEARLRIAVEEMGGDCIKSERLYRGFPDRMIMLNGRTIYVETKAPGGRLSPIQRFVHNDMYDRLGITVYVLWSIEEVDAFVNGVL